MLTGNPANVTATTQLRISTNPPDIVGGGAPNMAFLVGTQDGPNADAAHVAAAATSDLASPLPTTAMEA